MDATDLSVFDEFEFNHGSIVSLKLTDFMQFNYVEFWPGPTLNVILGKTLEFLSDYLDFKLLFFGLFGILIHCY